MCFFFFVFLSVGLTVSYTIRLSMYLFVSSINNHPFMKIHERWGMMFAGMSILVVLTVIMVSLLGWMVLNPYFVNLPYFFKLLLLVFVMMGFCMGFLIYGSIYYYNSKVLKFNFYVHFASLLWNLFFLPWAGMVKYLLVMSESLVTSFDQGWFELYGTRGVMFIVLKVSSFIQSFSKNYYKVYLVLMFIWLFHIYL